MKPLVAAVLFQFALLAESQEHRCAQRLYRGAKPNIVCVCNATYCDEFPSLPKLQPYQAAIYRSSQSGKRFETDVATFARLRSSKQGNNITRVKVNGQLQYQKIFGFGGAFTDAAGINLNSLSEPARAKLMNAYFSKNGIQYSTGRVPMASCDFSDHEYSYDDVDNDFDLQHFALTEEDFNEKIPYILEAKSLTGGDLKLIASPWSSPSWMKTTERMKGGGKLKGDEDGPYYVTWANYFIRFLQAYAKKGILFWGLTAQNEPTTGADPDYHFQTLYFSAEMQRDFIKNRLGPALQNSTAFKDVKLMIMDDNRLLLPRWAHTVLKDADAAKYVAGIAVHWYEDTPFFPASLLTKTHDQHPDKFILATEACNGWVPYFHGPILGDWARGESYAHDIIQDLNNWVSGWTDWNICLDLNGGPNWASNFVDSPIIVNASADEFYKQPMFYVMGHFSKFIRPDSTRIGLSIDDESPLFEGAAFVNPERQRVLVVSNRHDEREYELQIEDAAMRGAALRVTIEPHSIATILWNKVSI